MAFFKELEGIVNMATSMLLSSQEICKLVFYYPSNVDYQYNPLSQPDIENPSSLLLENIFPIPKIPDAETEQICLIDITISGGEPMRKNPRFRKVILSFDIICHLDAWFIKGGFRPIRLLYEIDRLFNFQMTQLNTINNPIPLPLVSKDYSNKFYGYELSYELQLNSNIECFSKDDDN